MTKIIPQHTVNRIVTITWKDQDGDIKPLTGATGITGVLRSGLEPNATDTAIAGALAIIDADLGETTWTLAAADTDTIGIRGAFFYATFPGGQVMPTLRRNIEFVSTPTPP